ncbi:MAG: PAS domain-containing protein [Verrucomicrobia bacterium]|nr:PAS domain-containing protein [Verrucomicrobiota bacterium]MBV8485800.1 PAS domain-containing protein [Verrucomicrobiota bacterium]
MSNNPGTNDGKMPRAASESDAPSRVVGIGASAGGLEAVSELLRHLPSNTGMAFVFIQHLEPRQTSRLTDILSRITDMTVEVATERLRMKRNHIYVMPPGADITLSDGLLILERRTESAGRHLPIDYFFHSLAKEQGSKAVAVILSGMGHDGSAGLKSIKEQGGTTFAQDEPSAQHGSMPASAIDSGYVDIVTTPRKIAIELVRIAQDRPAKPSKRRTVAENGLKNIFGLLRSRTEVDFSQYRKTTVRRRIQRRMVVHRIDDVDDYFTFLKRNTEEVDALFREMLIHVTGFFREPETFDVLQTAVLPRLLEKRGQNDPIRIWLPGCSTGEEAYSLAIIVTEFFDNHSESPAIQIFATDVSDRVLEIARKGVFDANIESAITKDRLRRFFSKNERGYQINKQIRDLCVFARQNVLRDPPFSRLDLISCRNVLIYFETAAQKKLIPFFHYALKPGGFLLLGGAETVGNFSDLFEAVDSKTKLFAKRSVQSPPLSSMEVEIPGPKEQALRDSAVQTALMQPDIRREVDRTLMDRYCPPTIVVDNAMKIIQFRGNVAPFLDPEPGEASLDLFRMLKSSLEMPLRSTINDAKKTIAPVRKEGILFQSGSGQATFLSLEVVPMGGSALRERCFLLLFEDSRVAVTDATALKGKRGRRNLQDARVSQLEQELATTREHLQTLIEEQESTNEELRSANEEIQSSNEELQSTNEELETAKEELQSTNEELITLNEELKSGNLELTEVNNDLTNLLKSVNIPIVMVDRGLHIRRFTPVAQRTLKLIPADVGRSITDLRADVEVPQLESLISEVMDTLSSREVEVRDRKGHWYNLQIRPYETSDNKITGAVMILFDVNSAKLEAERSKTMANYAEAFLETVRSSLVVLDSNLRIKRATTHFHDAFRLLPKETEGVSIFEVGHRQWDFPEFHALLEERLPQQSRVTDFECEHQFPRIGKKRIRLNVRQVEATDAENRLTIVSIEEVV